MLAESSDIAAINAVINHPAVRPYVGAPDAGPLDITPLVKPENLLLFGEHGGFLLQWSAPWTREVHTFMLPSGRGKWAEAAAREGIGIAYERATRVLWTKIPRKWPHIRNYAARMGMAATGETTEQFGEPYDVYAMVPTCQ